LRSEIPDFLVFLSIPFFVETIALEWTRVGVSLMIVLAVDTLEGVRI